MYLYVAEPALGLVERSLLLVSAFALLLALHDFLMLWCPCNFRLDSGGFPLEASEDIHFFRFVLLEENMDDELAFSFLLCSHGYIDLG